MRLGAGKTHCRPQLSSHRTDEPVVSPCGLAILASASQKRSTSCFSAALIYRIENNLPISPHKTPIYTYGKWSDQKGFVTPPKTDQNSSSI
jgi:hypothetical protein